MGSQGISHVSSNWPAGDFHFDSRSGVELITVGVAPVYVTITSVNLFGIAVLAELTLLRRNCLVKK
jgi:hypothetical protein